MKKKLLSLIYSRPQKKKKSIRTLIVFCLMATLTACQPKPLLPIPKGRILFSASYHNSNLSIYSINLDEPVVKHLTNNPEPEWDPIWSPDGTKIAFLSWDEGIELFKMNADDSHPMSLTPIYPGRSAVPSDEDVGPNWSPDGRKIIFTSYFHIKELDLESGRVSDLATNPREVGYPKWSPDGKKIMFISGDNGQVFIMNADGTDEHQIAKSPLVSILLDWSPDGRWVAVTNGYWISIMRPDGGQLKRLTHQCVMPYAPSAAFSSDSEWLVMPCDNEKEPGIYVINLEEGVLRKITNNLPLFDFYGIDWAP